MPGRSRPVCPRGKVEEREETGYDRIESVSGAVDRSRGCCPEGETKWRLDPPPPSDYGGEEKERQTCPHRIRFQRIG